MKSSIHAPPRTARPAQPDRHQAAQAARRRTLGWMAGVAAFAGMPRLANGEALACVATPDDNSLPSTALAPTLQGRTRAPGVLDMDGIVRSDIRPSFGGLSGTADGVALTLTVKVEDVGTHCAVLADCAVYVWHCTRDGKYSLVDPGLGNENYLRGVQVADAQGEVRFQTIFPGCYPGRYPHVRVEVYPGLAQARQGRPLLLATQLALPQSACDAVYSEAAGYEGSLHAFARVSMEDDSAFGNSTPAELAAQIVRLRGSVEQGFEGYATLGLIR